MPFAAAADQVTDLGTILHLIGGTVAAFIIFFLPGLMLVNAAILKGDAPSGPSNNSNIQDLQVPMGVMQSSRMSRGPSGLRNHPGSPGAYVGYVIIFPWLLANLASISRNAIVKGDAPSGPTDDSTIQDLQMQIVPCTLPIPQPQV